MNKIRVIVKEINKPAVVTEIDNNLETLQEIAGGPDERIDMCSFPVGENIDMIYADNYLNDGSMANFLMPEMNHIMGGTCIIAGFNSNSGSSISLTDEQIEIVSKYIEKNHVQNMDIQSAYYLLKVKEFYM